MKGAEKDLAIEARREVLRIKREHLGKTVDRIACLKDELAIAEADKERLSREVEAAELELDRLAPLDARAFAFLTKAGDHRGYQYPRIPKSQRHRYEPQDSAEHKAAMALRRLGFVVVEYPGRGFHLMTATITPTGRAKLVEEGARRDAARSRKR